MGFFSGVYSCLSATELRVDSGVCTAQCKTTDCYQGNGANDLCPMDLHPAYLKSNQLCKMCGVCVAVCPYNAVHFDLRWPGSELWENRKQDLATALAIPPLLAILYPLFIREGRTALLKDWLSFTLVFSVCVAVSLALFILASIPGGEQNRGKEALRKNLSAYGFAYLPLAFTGHLAFQLPYLMAGINRLFGYKVTEDFHTLANPWPQRFIILAGAFWSLWVLRRISQRESTGLLLSHAGVLILLGLGLLLVLQG